MQLEFLHPSLIVLAGPTGAGKRELADRLLPAKALIDLDELRERIGDDAGDQSLAGEALMLAAQMVTLRLQADRVAIVCGVNLTSRERSTLLHAGRRAEARCELIVLDAQQHESRARLEREGRFVPEKVFQRQRTQLASLRTDIARQMTGFDAVHVLTSQQAQEIESVAFVTHPAREVDVIGDVHGCSVELGALLHELGYVTDETGTYRHPQGRMACFLGDLVDRGPSSLEVLGIVDRMLGAGSAFIGALGNHDWKAHRVLVQRRPVIISDALRSTLDEVKEAEQIAPGAEARMVALLERMFTRAPAHSVLDGGRLVLTHGAVMPDMRLARISPGRRDPVSTFCMFGQDSGEREPDGRPVRALDWTEAWSQTDAFVCFGHEVMGESPRLFGTGANVLGLDTGCVFGGRLTALRWPEREIVSVGAVRRHDAGPEPAVEDAEINPLSVRRHSVQDVPRRTLLRAVS